jgi:alanyl-tRNA synthetase
MKHSDAIKKGAMALFGEKYEDEVRVVSIEAKGATHSIELCGGTHVTRLGELGVFKILYDTAIAAGVRRIEAVTATEALACFQHSYNLLKEAATTLQVKEEDITNKINEISQNKKKLEKELSKIKQINLSDLLKKAQTQQIGEIILVSDSFENSNLGELRNLAQQHVLNNNNNVVLLFSILKDSIGLVCGVSKNIKKQIKANNILDIAMKEFNGKGGGSDLIAQAVGQREIKSIEKSKNIVISLLNDIKNEKA